jgi:hypothetical protein
METDGLLGMLTVRYFALCLSNIPLCLSGFCLWRQINRLSLGQIFCILFVEYSFTNRVVCVSGVYHMETKRVRF